MSGWGSIGSQRAPASGNHAGGGERRRYGCPSDRSIGQEDRLPSFRTGACRSAAVCGSAAFDEKYPWTPPSKAYMAAIWVARHRPHRLGRLAAMRAAEFLAILCHVMR